MTSHRGFVLFSLTVTALLRSAKGFMCPTLFDFYPDPEHCSKFYRCFWGAAYSFDCPTGTLWNHKVLTCDFAYKVDCDKHSWESAADYVSQHKNDHTHDYLYDYVHEWEERPVAGPRDDSSEWADMRGDSGPIRKQASDSQAADSKGGNDKGNFEYETKTGPGYGIKGRRRNNVRKNKHKETEIDIKSHNQSVKHTTTTGTVDKILIDHLENLDPGEDKPDRKGSKGSFQKQEQAHKSQDTNVDYVYDFGKDDKTGSHGRFGYYGVPGLQRTGYYARPSQRVSFLWPFVKRK